MPLTSIPFPSHSVPEVLYHYTRPEAFKAIISDRILWLSDLSKMNDATERLWISDIFRQVERKRSDAKLGTREANHYYSDFQLDKTPIFIVCFSEEGGLLSQWRSYADEGQGLAIGFRTEKLGFPVMGRFIDEFMEEQQVAIARRVYDRQKQSEQIEALIAHFDRLFTDLVNERNTYSTYIYDGYLDTARWCLRNMSVISKNPTYSQEREWRAVYWPPGYGQKEGLASHSIGPEIQRPKEAGAIATHEWHLVANDLIEEVILGPKSAFTETDVQELLEGKGFTDFSVRRSEVSYP